MSPKHKCSVNYNNPIGRQCKSQPEYSHVCKQVLGNYLRCYMGIPLLENPTNNINLNLNGGNQVGRLETYLGCEN